MRHSPLRAYTREVNAAMVDPEFIVKVRKKLALDQREAAEIFGGGVNAFSRYETGKTRPPLALVKLLKVLDRHPELLDEIKVRKRLMRGAAWEWNPMSEDLGGTRI